MGQWSDALAKFKQVAGARGNVPGAALPRLSNRDTSGVLLFARSAAAYERDHGDPSASFDWYGFALPALGWLKTGDKFIMTDDQMAADYPRAVELWVALDVLATQLDAKGVPFEVSKVGTPAATDNTYRKLAADAWDVMQKSDPASAHAVRPNQAPAPASPSDVDAAARKKKSDGGGGVAVLALLALLALSDDKPRNRRRRY